MFERQIFERRVKVADVPHFPRINQPRRSDPTILSKLIKLGS